ncbi:MAG: hypothetical protein M0Z88_01745 [Actinomycetota bacterium]|nr:hypothetical protein [Actinomycetota bacterium]
MGDDRTALSMVLRLADQRQVHSLGELLAGLAKLPLGSRESLARSVAAYSFPELIGRLAADPARQVREAMAANPKVAEHPAVALAAVRSAFDAGDRELLARWANLSRVVELPEVMAVILKSPEAAGHLARKVAFARGAPDLFAKTFFASLESGRLSAARACLSNPKVPEFPEIVAAAAQQEGLAIHLLANPHLREYPSVVAELAKLPAFRRELAATPWIHSMGRAVDAILTSADSEAIASLLSDSADSATVGRIAEFATSESGRQSLAERVLTYIGSSTERLRSCLEGRFDDGACSAIEAAACSWVRTRAEITRGAEPSRWILAVAPFLQSPIPPEFVDQVVGACAGITYRFQPEPAISAQNLHIVVRLKGDALFRRAVFARCLGSECEAHVLASAAISLSRLVETNNRELLERLRNARPDFSESPFGSIVMSAIRLGGPMPA